MASRFFTSSRFHDLSTSSDESDYDFTEEQAPKASGRRFYATSQSEDEGSAGQQEARILDAEPEESSPDHEEVVMTTKKIDRNEFLARYLRKYEDEDDQPNQEDRKALRSHRDKRTDTINDCTNMMEQNLMDRDWVAASATFDRLLRCIPKQAPLSREELQVLAPFLEDSDAAMQEISPAVLREYPVLQAKAFHSLKQQVKRLQRSVAEDWSKSTAETLSTAQASSSDLAGEKESPEQQMQQVAEILQRRAKRGVESEQLLEDLNLLLLKSESFVKARILVAIITVNLEYNQSVYSHLPLPDWRSAFAALKDLLSLLRENERAFRLKEDCEDGVATVGSDGVIYLKGNLNSFLVRLDDELWRNFLFLDPFSDEYSVRLQEELQLTTFLERTVSYYQAIGTVELIDGLAIRMVEHLYHCRGSLDSTLQWNALVAERKEHRNSMGYGNLRRSLMLLFAYALDGNLEQSQSLLAAVRQESIGDCDHFLQHLYYRALVQVALLYFNRALFRPAYELLGEIFGTGIKPRDMLGQSLRSISQSFGIAHFSGERTPEERAERLRQFPYHLHFNLDQIEGIFFLTSILFEPKTFFDPKRKSLGRGLKKACDGMERSLFSTPPETTKECLTAAVSALLEGEWKRCYSLLSELSIWKQFSADSFNAYRVFLQAEFIQVYLQTFHLRYESFSLALLLDEMGVTAQEREILFEKVLVKPLPDENDAAGVAQVIFSDRSATVLHQKSFARYQEYATENIVIANLQEKVASVLRNFSW